MPFVFGVKDPRVMRYIKTTKDEVPKLLRMFGIEFYRCVTISTPVDTGRARYSWECGIDTPNFSIAPAAPSNWSGKSSGGGAYYQYDGQRAMNYFTKESVTINSRIYISNALPYISNLNNGSSKQAPARFVETAFNTAVNKLFIYARTKNN